MRGFRFFDRTLETYFFILSEDKCFTVWNLNWNVPMKIFNLCSEISNITLMKFAEGKESMEQVHVFGVWRDSVVKLDDTNALTTNLF